MSVLDKLEQRATGLQRPHTMGSARPSVALTYGRTGREDFRGGFAMQAEHVMNLRIETTFWANRAQVQDCARTGRKMLARLLYEDVLMSLSRIQHAITEDSNDEAYRLCDELRASLEG